ILRRLQPKSTLFTYTTLFRSQDVLDQNIIRGGEYQINDGIKAMKENGAIFVPGQVDEWMDCGNKDVTVETNGRMLKFLHGDGEKDRKSTRLNSSHVKISYAVF